MNKLPHLPREIYFNIFSFMEYDEVLKLQLLKNIHIYNCINYTINILDIKIKKKYTNIITILRKNIHNIDNVDIINQNSGCFSCGCMASCKICNESFCEQCSDTDLDCNICGYQNVCCRCHDIVNILGVKCNNCIDVMCKKLHFKDIYDIYEYFKLDYRIFETKIIPYLKTKPQCSDCIPECETMCDSHMDDYENLCKECYIKHASRICESCGERKKDNNILCPICDMRIRCENCRLVK